MSVPAAAPEREKVRAQALQSSFDVGLAPAIEVEAARTLLIEFESAVEMFQRKIGIRQTFLKGGIPAAVADLRALEAEADLRRTVLARRIEFAQRQFSRALGQTQNRHRKLAECCESRTGTAVAAGPGSKGGL